MRFSARTTLGVVESGAIADLLLIDGDPLEDITLLARPESSMLVIMKGGEIVKARFRPDLRTACSSLIIGPR
jgi:imidazolonepropionase-like amidohydrolase